MLLQNAFLRMDRRRPNSRLTHRYPDFGLSLVEVGQVYRLPRKLSITLQVLIVEIAGLAHEIYIDEVNSDLRSFAHGRLPML